MNKTDSINSNMTKRISLLIRKPGMSRDEFLKHWKDHEALAYGVPGLRRFVLSHIQDQPTRPDVATLNLANIDGVAESWWDSPEATELAYQSSEGKRWLAHGATFIGEIKTFVTREVVVIE